MPWRGVWALFDQGTVSLSNFLTVFLLARIMPIEAFGAFTFFQALLLSLVSIQSSLVTEPHNVLAAKMDDPEYRVFTTALAGVQVVLSLALGLLLVALGLVLHLWLGGATSRLVAVLGIMLPAWLAQEFVRRVLYTRSLARAAFVNDFISYGCQLGAVLWFAFSGIAPSAEAALAVLGASSLVAAAVGVVQIRDHLVFRTGTGPERLAAVGRAWTFGKWLLANNAINWFGNYGYTWLLTFMLGLGAVAEYRAAYHLVNVLNPLRQAAYSYFPSLGARAFRTGHVAGLVRWRRRVYALFAVPVIVIAAGLIVFAHPLLSLAYGSKYAGMGLEWVVAVGALSYFVNFARFPNEVVVSALERTRALFASSVISFVLLLTLGVALIYLLGIKGAPISQTVVGAVLFGYFSWTARREVSRLGNEP